MTTLEKAMKLPEIVADMKMRIVNDFAYSTKMISRCEVAKLLPDDENTFGKMLVRAILVFSTLNKYYEAVLYFLSLHEDSQLTDESSFEQIKEKLDDFLELKWRLYGQENVIIDGQNAVQEVAGYRGLYDIYHNKRNSFKIAYVERAKNTLLLMAADFDEIDNEIMTEFNISMAELK